MSSGSAKWETVSHKKKATNADKKAAQKALVHHAPTMDQFSPVEESSTIFRDAFSPAHRSNGSAKKPNGDAASHGAKNKQQQQQQKQKKKGGDSKKKPDRFSSLDEALQNLDPSEIRAQLEDVKNRVPDSPALWLGDVASLLNRKLTTKEFDPTFPDKPTDYPLCKLSSQVRKVLTSLVGSYQEKMLRMFFQHCIREIENDIPKGHGVNGYRIFIQLLAIEYPQFVTNHLSDHMEVFKRRQSDRSTSLTILWGCIQAGQNDPVIGLQVWSKLMLPLLGQKMVSPYAIATLNRFLGKKLDEKRASRVFGPSEFFPILDYVFTPNNSLPANLQKQLSGHYPRLKSIAFREHPESNLRNFFPSLLARTTDNCPETLKTELLECLVFCLCHDLHCFSEWRQMYDTHMKQSSVLMRHIISIWNQTKLPKKLFLETVRAFSVTNEELMPSRQGHKEFEDCRAACQELLEKMSTFTFPWKTLVTVVFLAIITFLALDFSNSGGFKGSRTEVFMVKSGLLVICQHAWAKISVFTANAVSWLQVNAPVYYSKVCELCGPYLTLALEKLGDLWVWLVTVTEPATTWIAENAPIWLDWLLAQTVIILQHLQVWLTQAWVVVAEYAEAGWVVAAPYVQQAWELTAHYLTLLWTVTARYLAIFWEAASPALQSAWLWLKDVVSKT